MNLKTAQVLAKCHRPGNPALQDPQVHKAVRIVEADPSLKAALADQVAFDDRQAAAIAAVTPPADFLDKIDTTLEDLQKGFQWKFLLHPAFLSGVIAVLVVVGALFWWGPDMMQDFPGRDNARLIIDATQKSPGMEHMTPKQLTVGDLGDWFVNKGYENFHVLPALSAIQASACGIFRQGGHAGAVVAFPGATNGGQRYLYVFPAEDFGIRIDPPDRWRYFQQGDWACAICADTDTCFMVAVRGGKSDVESYIASLGK